MNTNIHSEEKENQIQEHKQNIKKKQLKIRYENVFPHLYPNMNIKCIQDKNEIPTACENRNCNRNGHSVPRYLERQQLKMLMYVIRNLKWDQDFDLLLYCVTQSVGTFTHIICLFCGEIIAGGGGGDKKCWERKRDHPNVGAGCPIQRSIRNVTPCPYCRI